MDKKHALSQLDQLLSQMISTPMGRRTFLGSLGFLMAACATEQHRQREGDNTGQETEMSVAAEKRMTQEVLPKMREDYPAAQDAAMQAYIANLGRRLVLANKLDGNPYNYNFTVVDVNYVNAFALPAGTVFVTAPLIAMADNEAELAGVVGHEIGHIKARHTAERMAKAKRDQNKTWLYAAGGGLFGGALGYGLGRALCPPKDNECLAKAAGYGAVAGAGGGMLIQKYAFMANSREDEMEADRIGFRVAVGAGYDKNHVGTFYSKLLKMEQQSKAKQDQISAALADALSTHPPSRERVAQMNEMTSATAANPRAVTSTGDFDRIKVLCQRMAARQKPG